MTAGKAADAKETAFEKLNAKKGKLHELLIETHYTNSVPWILFVYDLQESNDDEIARRLEQCKDDLAERTDDRRQAELMARFEEKESKNPLSDQISFEDPFEEVPVDEYTQKAMSLNPTDYYRSLRLRMPEGMPQTTFALDYEELANRVLTTMHRARAQHRLLVNPQTELNALGDHLPPLDMKKVLETCNKESGHNSSLEYNTEERIRAIKKFVETNRRRRNKLELKAKRRLLEEEIARFDNYEALRERLAGITLERDIISSPEEEVKGGEDDFRTIS